MKSTRALPKLPNAELLILGAYAWLITAVSGSSGTDWASVSHIACVFALAFLVSGWLCLRWLPIVADYFAILGFCGCSATALLMQDSYAIIGPTPTQLLLGTVVWCLFGVSWIRTHHLSKSGLLSRHLPTSKVRATPSRGPRLVSAIAVIVVLVSLTLLYKADLSKRPGRGTLVATLVILACLKAISAAGTWGPSKDPAQGSNKPLRAEF